jgi:hypothetical protein
MTGSIAPPTFSVNDSSSEPTGDVSSEDNLTDAVSNTTDITNSSDEETLVDDTLEKPSEDVSDSQNQNQNQNQKESSQSDNIDTDTNIEYNTSSPNYDVVDIDDFSTIIEDPAEENNATADSGDQTSDVTNSEDSDTTNTTESDTADSEDSDTTNTTESDTADSEDSDTTNTTESDTADSEDSDTTNTTDSDTADSEDPTIDDGTDNLIVAECASGSSLVDADGDNFIEISSASEFRCIESNMSAHYEVIQDIDFNSLTSETESEPMSSIGNASTPFTGKLDGNFNTISNVAVNQSGESTVGLFAVLGGNSSVSNFEMLDSTITGRDTVGTVAGINNGRINNVTVISTTVSGYHYTGGVVGENFGSLSHVSVQDSTILATSEYSGGIAGLNLDQIKDVSVDSSVIKAERSQAGGLVGENGGIIFDSSVQGTDSSTIVTANKSAGGAIGVHFSSRVLNVSVADVDVSGKDGIGGFVGVSSQGVLDEISVSNGTITGSTIIGGFVGLSSEDMITNSYANSSVYGTEKMGGFIGAADNSAISSSYSSSTLPLTGDNTGAFIGVHELTDTTNTYYDKSIIDEPSQESIATGLSTTEMTGQRSLLNMSFDPGVWSSMISYPELRYQY